MKTHRLPIYGTTLVFCFSWSDYIRAMRREAGETPDPLPLAGITQELDNGHQTLVLGVFDGGITTLLHECAHAAFKILAHCGVDVRGGDTGREEPFCYLLEHIFQVGLTEAAKQAEK